MEHRQPGRGPHLIHTPYTIQLRPLPSLPPLGRGWLR